ncbi:sulfurtransferase [Candidatus Pacearchaeota archaeon]|nr:MAG: sulfurtransferase [Candidatus Pacearchaeota archaeon]
MTDRRITQHPVLPTDIERKKVFFTFNSKKMFGYENEMISSALIANGIDIFGHHKKDKSPQGIFCANGQCSQCTVIVDGLAVKSCMTPLKEGMKIESLEGLPTLPEDDKPVDLKPVKKIETDVLIIGGGPAGLSAAIELSKYNIQIIIVDDKSKLGGKLVLQTHKFFGSIKDSFAGTRGIQIGNILADRINSSQNIDVWLESTAIAVFSDKVVGILKKDQYILVKPKKLLVATGAREKMLVFPGNTLPGVYGAGAFQTLVNRDLVRTSDRIFIVGGGNVGLIAGYHAIQAGIKVVGLVEALPYCGGYKVHEDKLKRLGVPIFTSHTILAAHGKERVESITIAEIDKNFKPIKGTEKTFEVDTILIAVGLNPVNEFYLKAKEYGFDVWSAGDAKEIAEASAAMFGGKIAGVEIAKSFGFTKEDIPEEWREKEAILKSHPGKIFEKEKPSSTTGVYPIIHCKQEIPCNPCTSVCPRNLIKIEGGGILGIPKFVATSECIGCAQCVAICPGLAITLVDFRNDNEKPTITLPCEIFTEIKQGDTLMLVDEDGNELGEFIVNKVRELRKYQATKLVELQVPKEIAWKATSFKVQNVIENNIEDDYHEQIIPDDAYVCRCERVTAGEVRRYIRSGVKDMNELKAITRAGLGACGGKTCSSLIERIYREEGYKPGEYKPSSKRPLFVEVPLKNFSSKEEKKNE